MAPEFTVIKGGKDAKRTSKYRKKRDIRSVADSIIAKPPGLLIEAAATNTRLMGVTGLELVWETYNGSIFRQIFYLDAEEYGVETYISGYDDNTDAGDVGSVPQDSSVHGSNSNRGSKGVRPDSNKKYGLFTAKNDGANTGKLKTGYKNPQSEIPETCDLKVERDKLTSSLGGRLVPVTEKEARFLIQAHYCINLKYDTAAADNYDEYSFLLTPVQTLTAEEYSSLMDRIQGIVSTPYYAINYYIMRAAAGDSNGALLLCDLPVSVYPDIIRPDDSATFEGGHLEIGSSPGTLCRNQIERVDDGDEDSDERIFFCESLVEYGGRYSIIKSEIRLHPYMEKVTYAEQLSELKITSTEAAMQMSRPEYVSVFSLDNYSDEFIDKFYAFSSLFTESQYDSGHLYMKFKESNEHVGSEVYIINNDIETAVFLADSGQILVMAYDANMAVFTEYRLLLSLMPFKLDLLMKYEFREPVFYEFIRSGFEDFADFLRYLGGTLE